MTDLHAVIDDVTNVEVAAVTGWLEDGGPAVPPADRGEGLHDLLRLQQDDCWYDAPDIAVHYATWFHVRRATGLVGTIFRSIAALGEAPLIRIVDLGIGTGASLAAVCGLQRSGDVTAVVQVVGLDASMPMLAACREIHTYRPAARVDLDLIARSWLSAVTVDEFRVGPPTVVIGSYVLDNTDRRPARTDAIATSLARLASAVDADHLVILGGATKREATERARVRLEKGAGSAPPYRCTAAAAEVSPPGLRERRLPALSTARQRWTLQIGQQAASGMGRAPSSIDPTTRAWIFVPDQPSTMASAPWPASVLDETQLAAIAPASRAAPLLIIGAAGSGKSLALIEQVGRLVERRPNEHVLVTTFNVRLSDDLATGILRRTDGRVAARETTRGYVDLITDHGGRVLVANRDKLHGRVLRGGPLRPNPVGFNAAAVRGWLTQAVRAGELAEDALQRWDALLADRGQRFPVDELEAFLYGRQCRDLAGYLALDRTGAGMRLGPRDRELLWRALEWHRDEVGPLWGHARGETYRRFGPEVQAVKPRFDHAIVDEAQDFSIADLQLIEQLLPGPHRLAMFTDPNQAVHLGGTWVPPTFQGADGAKVEFERRHLSSSYRMPWLHGKALERLAVEVARTAASDVAIGLGPSRSALPGPRPILIDGDANDRRLEEVLRTLAVTHGVADWHLAAPRSVATSAAWRHRSRSLVAQRDKGLEFDAVAVDTSLPVRSATTHSRELYTLLTRSTRVLLVSLRASTPPPSALLLAGLDLAYVRFHDAAAVTRFAQLVNRQG